jgi:type II secretion system protein N
MSKSWVAYTLYALVLTGALLYARFPADAVERYLVDRVARAAPGTELVIGEIRPALPPGLVMEPVGLTRADAPLVRLDRLQLTPALLSLLGDRPRTDVDARGLGGQVEGELILARTGDGAVPEAAEAEWTNLNLSGLPFLQQLSPHAVTGLLDGNLTYEAGEGEATLTVRDGGVVFTEPLFNIPGVSFTRIDARLSLTGGRTLTLTECTLAGNQVGGSLSGTLTLSRPLESSSLNLTGELRPHPTLLAGLGDGAAMLLRQRRGPIPFAIRGPLASPRFSLN